MSNSGLRLRVSSERRSSARRGMFIAGSAVTVQGSKSIVVEDLSSTGARIRGRDLPAFGKQVLIWIEGLDVLGSVAWCARDECGVRFDLALEPQTLTGLEAQAVGTLFAF